MGGITKRTCYNSVQVELEGYIFKFHPNGTVNFVS